MAAQDIGIRLTASDQTGSAFNSVKAGLGTLKDGAETVKSALAGMAAGFGVVSFATKLVDVQRQFDVLNSSLITVTGSSARAAQEMDWIRQFAATTPFQLAQVTDAFVKMRSLGLDASVKSLASYGNTASAMGKSLNQMVEAVADAATGEFERLKEFGIKASKEGDKVSLTFQGVTTTVANSAAEITKYLQGIGDVQFGGAMETRAQTLDGAISNLADSWDALFLTVSQNNAGTLIHDSVKAAAGSLADATTIINAMSSAASANARDTGAMATMQEALAITMETVAVLGANVKYVLVQVGAELGGLAAQAVQILQGNFAGAAAIREAMVADSQAARAEVDATTERILGARRAAQDLAQWNTRNAGAATDPRRLDAATQATNANTTATAANAKAAKEAAKAREELIKAATRSAQALADTRNKEADDISAYMRAESNRLADTARASEDAVRAAQEEYDNHGKLRSEIAQTTLARLQDQLVNKTAGTEAYESLQRQIAAQKQLISIMQNTEVRAAAEAGASALVDANRKAAEESGQYWEDALMRAFESGQGFFESLWSTIKNTLKTQVLKVLVTGTLSGLGLSGAAAAGGGGGVLDLVNGAANLNTLYGAGSQYLFGGTAGASSASLLAGNAAGMMGGDALGTMIAANGNWAGVATAASESAAAWATAAAVESNALLAIEAGATAAEASAAALAANAAGGATAPSVAGGLGATGYGLIAAAAIAAIMYITSRGETRSGATYTTGADGLAMVAEGPSGGEIAAEASRAIFNSTQASINATLAAVGSKATITGFTAGLESSENGKGFAFAGGMVGNVGVGEYKGRNGGQFAMSDLSPQQALESYVMQMNQVTLEALQAASDVPTLIAKELAGVDISKLDAAGVTAMTTTVQSVIESVNVFRGSLLALPFKALHDLSFQAAAGLVDAAGGFEALTQNLGGFYDNFYTGAEQTANLTRTTTEAFAALGLTMPAVGDSTRDWYRTLVETTMAQDMNVASNQALLTGVLSLQGAMDQLAPAFEDVEASVKALISGVSSKASATLWGMQYGMKDDAGKYGMLDVRAAGINNQMLGSSDINAIASLANQQIDVLNDAFSLLDASQQRASYLEFESRINAVEDYVIAKGADAISLKKAENEAMATTIATMVAEAVAKAMESSAAALQAAADKAETPIEVTSNVNVTVTAPVGSEVSIA